MTSRPVPPPGRANPRVLLGVVALVLAAAGGVGYVLVVPEWQAERAFRRAEAAAADADHDAARAHLADHLRLRPGSPQGHFLLARTLRRADDLAAARKELREAEKLGWSAEEVEIEGHLIDAQEVGPRGRNELALQGRVLARHPAERVILEALAKGYRNAHRPEAAVKWLGIWVTRFPDDWLPHLWRGEVLEAFGLTDDARADFLRVVELRPGEVSARRRLGRLELGANQPAAAAGHFAVVLEVAPDDPDALLGLAECERRAGDAAAARGRLDRLLARDPGSPRACLEAAVLEADAGRTPEALALARRADAALPDEPQLHYRLGMLYNRLDRPDAAAPHLARFRDMDAAFRRTTELTKQLLQNPASADLRAEIGAEFLRLGHDATAVAWLSSALVEKPDHAPAHRALAGHYRRTGDAARADQHARLAGPPP